MTKLERPRGLDLDHTLQRLNQTKTTLTQELRFLRASLRKVGIPKSRGSSIGFLKGSYSELFKDLKIRGIQELKLFKGVTYWLITSGIKNTDFHVFDEANQAF